MTLVNAPAPQPAYQAARILNAWRSRNAAGLREELERSLELPEDPKAGSMQEERCQLLRAITVGIKDSPNPLTPDDAKLRRCLDLLQHLAQLPH